MSCVVLSYEYMHVTCISLAIPSIGLYISPLNYGLVDHSNEFECHFGFLPNLW
jgi:hypothetical protein